MLDERIFRWMALAVFMTVATGALQAVQPPGGTPGPPANPGPGQDILPFGLGVSGSWFGSAQTESEELPPGLPDTITMLLTFNKEGTVLGTDTTNFGANPVSGFGSPAHGAWTAIGRRGVAFTFLWMLFSPEGDFIGIFKIRGEGVRTGADGMVGQISGELFAADQNPLDPAQAGIPIPIFDFTLQRIAVERLD